MACVKLNKLPVRTEPGHINSFLDANLQHPDLLILFLLPVRFTAKKKASLQNYRTGAKGVGRKRQQHDAVRSNKSEVIIHTLINYRQR